jgi:hypothetical protein
LANALGVTGVAVVTDKEGCVRSMRFVVVLLAAIAASLALSMAGCGNSPAPPSDSSGIIGLMVMVGGIVERDIPASATVNPGRYVHVTVTFSVG